MENSAPYKSLGLLGDSVAYVLKSATGARTNKKRGFVQDFKTITTKFLESLDEPRQSAELSVESDPLCVTFRRH